MSKRLIEAEHKLKKKTEFEERERQRRERREKRRLRLQRLAERREAQERAEAGLPPLVHFHFFVCLALSCE